MSIADADPLVDAADVEPHLFAGDVKSDTAVADNVLRFARDHGFTLTFPHGNENLDQLDDVLEAVTAHGVETILNTGSVQGHTSRELVEDEDALDEFVGRTLAPVHVYADHYPAGRIYLWHEAPMFGDWVGDDQDERAESVLEHGPEIFAAQKRAIRDHHPDIDVGIFVHNPFVAPPSHTETPIFGRLMDALRDRPGDVLPDFTYCDVYRGYYEWEVGYEAVNEYLRGVLSNAREQTGGRPVYYLGQAHTINNNHTPSKQAIEGNLRTALATGVESYGWYLRESPRETHRRNYDPFVPNVESVAGESQFNSWTGSRDRLRWAALRLLEATANVDPESTFDLWLYGEDLGFYEHRLSLAADGEWEFVGDFSGYVDGGNPYSGSGLPTVAAFCGLDADRYLGTGLDFHVESTTEDGAELRGVYVLPYLGAANYVPEHEASTLVQSVDVASHALGALEGPITIDPGRGTKLSVPVDEPERPPSALPGTPNSALLERLRALEDDGTEAPCALFDLWVYGDDLSGATVTICGEDVTESARGPAGSDRGQALVVDGLSRDRFWERHRGGHQIDLRIEVQDRGRARAAYAMPFGGSGAPVTAEDVAAIVEREYGDRLGQIDQFALGSVAWPPDFGGAVHEAELQVVSRRLVERGAGTTVTL